MCCVLSCCEFDTWRGTKCVRCGLINNSNGTRRAIRSSPTGCKIRNGDQLLSVSIYLLSSPLWYLVSCFPPPYTLLCSLYIYIDPSIDWLALFISLSPFHASLDMSHEMLVNIIKQQQKLVGEDPKVATFVLRNEDHTLGNALRYVLMKKFRSICVPVICPFSLSLSLSL